MKGRIANPRVYLKFAYFFVGMGIFFLLLVSFFLLSPLFLYSDDLCSATTTLGQMQQASCSSPSRIVRITAKVESKGEKFIKVYRTSKSPHKIDREMKYYSSSQVLNSTLQFVHFRVVTSLRGAVRLSAWCTSGDCQNVKIFSVTDDEYEDAVHGGEFDDEGLPPAFSDLSHYDAPHDTPLVGETYSENDYGYIVISCKSNDNTVIGYHLNMTYHVYDTHGLESHHCDGECIFDNVDLDEMIIMDNALNTSDREPFEASLRISNFCLSAYIALPICFGAAALFMIITASVACHRYHKAKIFGAGEDGTQESTMSLVAKVPTEE